MIDLRQGSRFQSSVFSFHIYESIRKAPECSRYVLIVYKHTLTICTQSISFPLAYSLLMKRRAAKRRTRWGRMYLEKT